MGDYLLRDQAPLSPDQWEQIDSTVKSVAERNLVGRRLVPVFGPLGPGLQAVPADTLVGAENGAIDFVGEAEGSLIHLSSRDYIPLPIIYKDFRLHWRDLESASQLSIPLDVSPAAAAAAFCARAEDHLIFNGCQVNGREYRGLTNAEGRNQIPMSDWQEAGAAFSDVVAAVQRLVESEFCGPYAVVVNPRRYAGLNRLFGNSGVLELQQVQQVATAGVYQTPVLRDDVAVVVSVGAENMDLAVSQDLVTAFLETSNMNHYFRVFEILALRVKRPGAICTIEQGLGRK